MDCEYLHNFDGLKFMPVTDAKKPIITDWTQSTDKHDLSNCKGVGLICGRLSGNLEAIDVDCKYDLTGKLYESYKRGIEMSAPNLFGKLLVQKTRGGGYHLIYRCSTISGNSKLANRPSTEDEKEFTYNQSYEAYFKDPKVKVKTEEGAVAAATKAKAGDKIRVLLETRGEGGYIMTTPSDGYELVQRDYYGIEEITIEERDILHSIARQFNQVLEEVVVPKTQIPKFKTKGKTPFEDYNERADIVQLLTSHGWKFVKNKGNKIHFQRPGQTSAETSGNFDISNGWFSVFTTSTEFEPNHGYRPYAVFAVLECNKDFSEASRKLLEMGYGDKDEIHSKEKSPSTRIIQSRVDPNDNDLSFLATGADYDTYLQQVRDGTLPMGLTTGSLALDEYFLLKKGNLVMFNGIDNVGKSVWVWWIMLLSAMYHGWSWIVFSSENGIGSFMRKMIQFYWGKPLRGIGAQTQQEFDIAKAFVEKHFRLIKHEETLYNYKDIMNMIRKARKALPEYQYGFIDPYNSLKTDLSGFSKISTHDYHYEAMSELQSDCQANGFTWYVNHHVITEATRKVDSEGYQVAPNKADTEGGGKVANKAHDFVTVHRKTNHPQDWNITEAHVRKIKDTETGGKISPLNHPVKFKMINNQCAFEEVLEQGGSPINPVQRWHQTRTAKTEDEKHWADRKDFQTFTQFKESEQYNRNWKTEVIASIPKSEIDGYVPDDEEARQLRELLKREKPF